MRKLLSGILVFTLVFLNFAIFAPLAAAAGVALSPPKFEIEANPGDVISERVSIANQGSNTIALSTSVQDFVASGETGQASFIDADQGDSSISISNWVEMSKQNIVVNPGEKVTVDFQIRVPEDAEPGGHYGAIFFAPPAGEGQVSLQQRIGSLVLVKVSGDIISEGRLDRFGSFDKDIPGEEIAEQESQFFFRELPIPLAVRYENTGNVHLKPAGKIELFNTFGQPVKAIGAQSVFNDRGVEISREIVDYIPFNGGKGNVLANSFRTFREEFKGKLYWFYHEDGTKEIRDKGNPLGLYQAKLTLDSGEVETFRFLIFPVWKVLGGVTGVVIFIVILLKLISWNNRRLEEKFAKKFGVKQ